MSAAEQHMDHVGGAAVVLTARELTALFAGVGPIGLALYLALRSQMDFRTGLVGASTAISRQGLIWMLRREIPRGKGVQAEDISTKDLRMALDALVRHGLLVRGGGDDVLVFRMPLAYAGKVRANQTGPSAGRGAGRVEDGAKPSNGAGLRVISGGIPEPIDPSNRADICDQRLLLSTPQAASGRRRVEPVDNFGAAASDENLSEAQMVAKSKIVSLLKDKGIKAPSGSRIVREWVARGYTVQQLQQSIEKARLRRANDGSCAPLNLGLIDTIVQQDFAGKGARDQLEGRARALGITARPGDSWNVFRQRIIAAMADLDSKAAEYGISMRPDESLSVYRNRVMSAVDGAGHGR